MDRPSSDPAADAADGPGGDLPGAQDQQSAPSAQDLSLSAREPGDRPLRSCLVRRHHLHPGAARVLYLVAIMDWATRHVLAWRLSNTMDTGFCIEALREAMARHGKPEIFNTDQGSQFTSLDFTGVLKDAGVAISMDGRGRCMDNIFIERLWRSLKYEAVYLHEMTDGFAAERVIGTWIDFYNTERPHSALDGATPTEAYSTGRPD